MEEKNEALVNEAMTLYDCVNSIRALCDRLTPDKFDVNAATIRSLNSQADALNAELFNLRKLIDEYIK